MLTPVMLSTESARKLALRLAHKGEVVVYRCPNMKSINEQREATIDMLKRRHWFSHLVLGSWHWNCLWIRHRPAGAIHFVIEGLDIAGAKIALEVRA